MALILASQSPRRQELIRKITEDFRAVPSSYDESETEFHGDPQSYVTELACAKASEVFMSHQEDTVIGMDTIVFIDGDVLNKPRNEEEAVKMMRALSGRMHEVYTGFCIKRGDGGEDIVGYEETDVFFDEISDEELIEYIRTGDWKDKSGAYAIQGEASKFVSNIAGDFFNVVGFPVNRIYRELRKINYPLW